MKSLFIAIFISLIPTTLRSQIMVTSDILQNVFLIKYGNEFGTCFRISFDNEDYLITAKHLFNATQHNSIVEFEILKDTGWIKLMATFFEHENNDIDIAVLALKTNQIKENKFNLKGSYYLSQECFFLGFPFGLKMDSGNLNSEFPIPFVKGGIISSFITDSLKNMTRIFIDGHNNPGFSGGPVVVKDQSTPGENKMSIIAVVSAYLNEKKKIKTPYGEISNQENSGIVISYSIKHVFEILERK